MYPVAGCLLVRSFGISQFREIDPKLHINRILRNPAKSVEKNMYMTKSILYCVWELDN